MRYVARRFGFQLSRGWFALILVVGALVGAAFWVGPFKPQPPELQLVGLSGDGRFHQFVGIPSAWADTLPAASETTARFPLVLAVYNAGAASARPNRLAMSLPSRFRVTDADGQPLPFFTTMGNPLVRYELPVHAGAIEPGKMPTIIAGLDTLYLEPVVPTMYCTAVADSVPEFVAAPPMNPELMSRVRIFYSFAGERIRQRQTGLLTIQVDPNLVRRAPAPTPPIFPTEVFKPAAPKPELGVLTYAGSRETWCGDPGHPLEIYNALWHTADGGRFFVVYYGGAPRKYLFDLNRDSIIELEMWDHDSDGKFESRRAARMLIPGFLMPYRKSVRRMAGDSISTDSTLAALDTTPATPEFLRVFYDTTAGPLRFGGKRADAAPPPPATAAPTPPGTIPAAPSAVPLPPAESLVVDVKWVRLFNNHSAGPLRFYRALHGIPEPPPRRPPRSQAPKLLGVPIDSLPGRQ